VLPLESPWLRALLPLEPELLPLLRQELLRGDTGLYTVGTLGMSIFTPLKPDVPAELLEPTWPTWHSFLAGCLLSCLSHSSREEAGLQEDRDRGMETPSPGTPLTPFQWLEASRTISGWAAPPCPVCPSLY